MDNKNQSVVETTALDRPSSLAHARSYPLIGVELTRFVLAGKAHGLTFAFVGLVIAVVAGLVAPRPFVEKATLRVGVGASGQLLEDPEITRWRLEGALMEAALDLGERLDAKVSRRPAEYRGPEATWIDVQVRAATASTASVLVDRGLAAVIAAHQAPYLFEVEVATERLALLEASAPRLGGVLDKASVDAAGARSASSRQELEALSAQVFELQEHMSVSRRALSPLVAKPTAPVMRTSRAKRQPSPLSFYIPAGILGGLLLGYLVFGVRQAQVNASSLRSPPARPTDGQGWVSQDFIAFAARHSAVLLIATSMGLGIGIAASILTGQQYEGWKVILLGRIDSQGSVHDLANLGQSLEEHHAAQVFDGLRHRRSDLKAKVLRETPPSSSHIPVIHLGATASSSAIPEEVLTSALHELSDRETDLMSAELSELERRAAGLRGEIERLSSAHLVASTTHAALVTAINRYASARFALSPLRSHRLEQLAASKVEATPWVAALGAVLGALFGLLLGFVIAFIREARRDQDAPRGQG